MKEIWKPRHVRQAEQTVNRLKAKQKLTSADNKSLSNARLVTRRWFLQRAVAVGAVTVAAGAGIVIVVKELGKEPVYEETYLHYLNSFESVAKDDEEATKLLNFFKERRKRGILRGDMVIADEPGQGGLNFWTVIVDPVRHKKVYDSMEGFSKYVQNETPTRLLLQNIPVSSLWSGVLLAHESVHIYQWFNRIEQSRPNGFIQGEQEAYELELRLIDKATGGRFKQVLLEQAKFIEPDKNRGMLSSDDYDRLSSLFSASASREEDGLRIPAFTIAINFAAEELRSTSPQAVKQAQMRYLDAVYSGRIPIMDPR